MLTTDKSDPAVPKSDPTLPPMGDGYRLWLIYLGIHLGVVRAQKDPARGFTLAEIRRDVWELDVLDGFDRKGDAWLAMLPVYGPFERVAGTLDRYTLTNRVFTARDFPMHMPPPAVSDTAWKPPNGAEPTVGSKAAKATKRSKG
jgi:hypothetical protein